jgi:hypothetical protein
VEQGLDTILATVNAVVQRVKEYEADAEPVEGGVGVPVAPTPGGPPPAADAVSYSSHLGVVVTLCTVPSCARVHRCHKRLSQTSSRISFSAHAVRVVRVGQGGGVGVAPCAAAAAVANARVECALFVPLCPTSHRSLCQLLALVRSPSTTSRHPRGVYGT